MVSNICHQNPSILHMMWFSDGAGFHLSEYIHSQNTQVLGAINPQAINQKSLYPLVGCSSLRHKPTLIGPIFFHMFANTDDYFCIFQ
jgi:hypothetical protein